MAALYLTEAEVEGLLDMPSAVAAVEEAFGQLAAGQAANVPRQRAMGRGIVLHSMSAAADYLGLVGWKCYATTKAGAKFLVGLYESQTGSLVALLEADRLGQMRTGATTGVAVRHLSAPSADQLGLLPVMQGITLLRVPAALLALTLPGRTSVAQVVEISQPITP